MLKFRYLNYKSDDIMEKYVTEWILWTINSDFSANVEDLNTSVKIFIYNNGRLRVSIENENIDYSYNGYPTEFDLLDLSIFYCLGFKNHNTNLNLIEINYVS